MSVWFWQKCKHNLILKLCNENNSDYNLLVLKIYLMCSCGPNKEKKLLETF